MLPTIHILATGGTIGFKGDERLDAVAYGEHGSPILIKELLARISGTRRNRSNQQRAAIH